MHTKHTHKVVVVVMRMIINDNNDSDENDDYENKNDYDNGFVVHHVIADKAVIYSVQSVFSASGKAQK